MQEWINQVLQSPNFHVVALPASFLLGIMGALNPCCRAPILAAVAGYSGSLAQRGGRRVIVLAGVCFMIGTILALGVVGATMGFVGQLVRSNHRSYWNLVAGFTLIFFGLACMNLVPIKMPTWDSAKKVGPIGLIEPIVFGLLVGGLTTLLSAAGDPTLAVTVGVATLQGHSFWGMAILVFYAAGYSLPLAGGIIGLGLGARKLTSMTRRLAPIVQNSAGAIQLIVGFALLARV